MARGRDRHQARAAALAALGKDLSRRARSKCEVCAEAGALKPVALSAAEAPTLDDALLLCERCTTLLSKGRHDGAETLRFLEEAVWAEFEPVQVAAVKMLETLVADDVARWPAEVAENLWLSDEARARVDGVP